MKLYKNTLIISVVVFCICILLSFLFEFTCISEFKIILFLSDYMIGIACSIIVVIITTFLQFKYEQNKLLNSILSEVQFFFFHYLLLVISLNSNEKTPDKFWDYSYDETYNGIKKISSELSNIEWFSKNKVKTTRKLQKAALDALLDIMKFTDKNNKNSMLCIVNKSWLKEIKNNAMLLIDSNEYTAKEIVNNYEKILEEIKGLEVCQE